jgi:hypothetical protein
MPTKTEPDDGTTPPPGSSLRSAKKGSFSYLLVGLSPLKFDLECLFIISFIILNTNFKYNFEEPATTLFLWALPLEI